jgi:predicted RNA-binding Zn ribbon-like protein
MSSSDRQPAGRAPAPEDLGLVQAFINTYDIEADADQFRDRSALARFLTRHGLAGTRVGITGDDHRRALELREALRALAAANNGEPLPREAAATLDGFARRSGLIAGFGPGGEPRETPTASGADRAFGELLAIVHRAIRDGTWPRVKACREHDCRWVFYDNSRNRSSTWCAMSVCGSRSKMRAYRARRETASSA